MIVTKTNPAAEDYAIDRLQKWIQPILFDIWGIDPDSDEESATYIFYPRAYRNQTENGFIAEVYLGEGEYKEVYWNDTLSGLTWFGLGSKITNDIRQVVDIHLVTFANVEKLYPTVTHRADAEIRRDFANIFAAPILGFELISTETWLANVLREYPGSRRDDRLRAADMGAVHAFRLNLRLTFDPAQVCTEPFL